MKVGEHKLLFDCLTDNILDELLDASDILQHMLIRLPQFALDENLREKTLADGKRLRRLRVVIPLGVGRGAALRARAAARRRAVRVEAVEHAQMDAPAAFVRDGELAVEDEPGDGELDGERHEQRGGVVDPQGRRERQPQVGVPRDV